MVLSGNGQPQPPRELRDNQHIFFSRVVKKYVFYTRPQKVSKCGVVQGVWEGGGGGRVHFAMRGHRGIVGSKSMS